MDNTVNGAWRAVLDASRNSGIAIDSAYAAARMEQLSGTLRSARAQIMEMAGEEFDLDSSLALGIILFEKLGLSPVRRVGVAYSVSNYDIERLEHPISEAILAYKHADRDACWIAQVRQASMRGRVRPTFEPNKVGRITTSKPNVQGIPEPVRSLIISDPGCMLIQADWNAMHLRLLANLSMDPELIHLFEHGKDPFVEMAAMLFHKAMEDVTADERATAKITTYSLLYGSSCDGVADGCGLQVEAVKAYKEAFSDRFPRIHRWTERTYKAARKAGQVLTICGRQLCIDDLASKRVRRGTLVSRVLQGSEADILMGAITRTAEMLRGIGGRVLFPIHDALLVQAPLESAIEAAAMLRAAMTDIGRTLAVPLAAKVTAGQDWGHMHAC